MHYIVTYMLIILGLWAQLPLTTLRAESTVQMLQTLPVDADGGGGDVPHLQNNEGAVGGGAIPEKQMDQPKAKESLLAKLEAPAQTYADGLAKDNTADYVKTERHELRVVAEMLLKRNLCTTALGIAKQIVAGVKTVTTGDWLRVAQAAVCAQDWSNGVMASYLASRQATSRNERYDAFEFLGKALEGHSEYGIEYALAAYQMALDFGSSPTIRTKIEALTLTLTEQQLLRVDTFEVKTEHNTPSICFTFSTDMPNSSMLNYADFIRFEPAFLAKFYQALDSYESSLNRICADGAKFGTSYTAHILPGLVASNGAKLATQVDYTIDVDERPARVWFNNSRYVLPIGGGVPIHAVNATKAFLALYRIVDRNLLNEEVRDTLRTDLSTWRIERIRNEIGEQVWQGTADLTSITNEETITNLPMAQYLPPGPGIYVLVATIKDLADADYSEKSTLWLLVSDIGITSYQGDDGLTLMTRSLTSGEPLPGVRLSLYARNNRSLAEASTDAMGVARLPVAVLQGQGSLEPMMVMASINGGGADGISHKQTETSPTSKIEMWGHPTPPNGVTSDFNFLDVSTAPYDFSARGAEGRSVSGPVDAFVYTERGVYRPGETVHITAILRDDSGKALAGSPPLTVKLLRPDEQVADQQVLQAQGAGGYAISWPISATARMGTWKVLAYLDPKSKALGFANFQVEAIVPPRLELNLTQTPTGLLKPGDTVPFAVQALYLFGAPGADLTARGELRVGADPKPFANFANYHFGPQDEAEDSVLNEVPTTRTDDAGKAVFEVTLNNLPKLEKPLLANLRAEVVDVDGRAVAVEHAVAVRHKPMYIGIAAPDKDVAMIGKDGTTPAGAMGGGQFKIIAVAADGQPMPVAELHYTLVEEQADYQWYQESGRWQFKRQVKDRHLSNGKLTLTTTAPALVAVPTATGNYRLEVNDPTTGIRASASAQVGWTIGEDSEAPDQLLLSADKDKYKPGDIAKLTIQSPFVGPASLVLATNRVHSIQTLVLTANKQELTVPVDAAWGAGVYAMVTVYRPDAKYTSDVGGTLTSPNIDAQQNLSEASKSTGHGPRRAVGLSWLGITEELWDIPLAITVPKFEMWGHPTTPTGSNSGIAHEEFYLQEPQVLVRPRQNIEIQVHTTGTLPATPIEMWGHPTTPIYVTLAAVDEGVLRLTDYQNPDPLEYYFGQRALDVGLRDLYGRLIDGHLGTPGRVRSGGDENMRRGAPNSKVEIVSLFSGIVPLNSQGAATIPLSIPDFNGKLRLVAVAWSTDRVGKAHGMLTVRDPVVLMPSAPRFMAAGDHSQVSLLINNMDGVVGDYQLSWTTTGASATKILDLGNIQAQTPLSLAAGQRRVVIVPLQANAVGDGTLQMRLTAPNGEILERNSTIGVRAPFLPESQSILGRLSQGQSIRFGGRRGIIPQSLNGTTLNVGDTSTPPKDTKMAAEVMSSIGDLRPETTSGLLSVSTTPNLNVPGLLQQLDLYPYGCLEQVTSRALPLLYVAQLGAYCQPAGGDKTPHRGQQGCPSQEKYYRNSTILMQRLASAITNLLEKQQLSGGFAMWHSDGTEEAWLSVYALDFLHQVKTSSDCSLCADNSTCDLCANDKNASKGTTARVPDFMWRRGLEWLRRQLVYPNTTEQQVMAVQAYAVYLLTKYGEAPAETARYMLDQIGERLPSSLAAAQLGAAFAMMGDDERATTAFALAQQRIRMADVHDYGSKLRDLAALVLLLHEAKQPIPDQLVQTLAQEMADNPWLSTQEQAWLVRAAAALIPGQADYLYRPHSLANNQSRCGGHPHTPPCGGDTVASSLQVDGPKPLAIKINGWRIPDRPSPLTRHIEGKKLMAGLELTNSGTSDIWYSLAITGSPMRAPPVLKQGLSIKRRWLDLTGKALDANPLLKGEGTTTIVQGNLIVVVLEGEAANADIDHQTLIVDPLPTGLEIENPNLANATSVDNLQWLGELSSTEYSAALDDRFVAALDLDSSSRKFKLAYMARAVAPGRYQVPPPLIEDMYKPHYRGRGKSGRLVVKPAQ